MNKIAVLYKSKYGSTEKYAKWISEELNADLFEVDKVKLNDLLQYDTIIFGGGIYASSINGIKIITKNYNDFKDKKIVIFTVSLASPDNKEFFKSVIEKNFTKEISSGMQFFHFQGGLDYKKMTFIHKSMMGMLKKIISKKKPEELSKDDKVLIETYGKSIDFTNKAAINPLILVIKNNL